MKVVATLCLFYCMVNSGQLFANKDNMETAIDKEKIESAEKKHVEIAKKISLVQLSQSEEIPKSSEISDSGVTNTNYYYSETLNTIIEPLEQEDTRLTTRDYASLVIASAAVLGFIINLTLLGINRKDRKSDKQEELFLFWQKDVIFPDYIKPIVEELDVLGELYSEVVDGKDDEKKSKFLQFWMEHKIEIKSKVNSGTKLPYFNALFTTISLNLNNIEDKICHKFYEEEIVSIPGAKSNTDTTPNIDAKNPFFDLAQLVYEEIYNIHKDNCR